MTQGLVVAPHRRHSLGMMRLREDRRGLGLDPRAVRRDEVARLRALGVEITEIGRAKSRSLFDRFVREFIAPEHAARFLDDVKRRGLDDLQRWMRHDRTLRTLAQGSLAWLAPREELRRCVRFEKRPDLPALEVELATMDEAWATSWPGAFVSFEAGRALVVTVDYEVLRCDRGARLTSPYR
ncbi:MAG: hypothetical protein ABJE95_12545 [Byssovorax sp.]